MHAIARRVKELGHFRAHSDHQSTRLLHCTVTGSLRYISTMPLEANLFYGGVPSPTSSRSSSTSKRPLTSAGVAASSPDMPVASTSRLHHTPNASHTSRIPPPPSSPTPTPRRRSGGGSRRRPATFKVSPDKFKLHFQGRVYRPFAATSPPNARKLYSPSQGLLGQPDELVDDADAIIDCPCERNIDDSSLMIQCEECEIWLHARCVGIQYEEECPQEYYCRKCVPSSAAKQRGGKSGDRLVQRNRQSTPEAGHSTNRQHSPPSSTAVSESDDDGGLEVEIPTPLASSPLNRTPTRTPTKRNPASPSQYSISRNLLSDFANASPIIKASPSHPLLTPSKRSKAAPSSIQSNASTTPSKRSKTDQERPKELDSSTVPLPEHYTALLNLHAAVERALLLHLATEGSKACSAAVAMSEGGALGAENLVVDVPNLATFTGIRAVVERGANKRFGPTELAQLVWLWEGGLNGPQASEDVFASSPAKKKDGRRGGLSMTVSSSRELDRSTGKRVHTWGIGIHLELKQNVQLPALEVVGGSPTSVKAQDVGSSPSLKRVGMSVLPWWSSKAEYRREEMRRRLGECVIKAHEDFSAGSSSFDAGTHKKCTSDSVTLPPTPPPSNSKKSSSAARNNFIRGFILDALPPIPAATLPPLGPSSVASLSSPALLTSQGVANADVADIAREERDMILPSTRDTSSRPSKAVTEERRQMLLNGSKETAPKAPAAQRAISLLDRVSILIWVHERGLQSANILLMFR